MSSSPDAARVRLARSPSPRAPCYKPLGMEMRPEEEGNALQALCDACRHLHARNLLAAADGNISLRFSDERIAMTPAGVNKQALRPEQLTFLRLDGTLLSGNPSSERAMHLAVYRLCAEARAVIHAHPPTAIAPPMIVPVNGFVGSPLRTSSV